MEQTLVSLELTKQEMAELWSLILRLREHYKFQDPADVRLLSSLQGRLTAAKQKGGIQRATCGWPSHARNRRSETNIIPSVKSGTDGDPASFELRVQRDQGQGKA